MAVEEKKSLLSQFAVVLWKQTRLSEKARPKKGGEYRIKTCVHVFSVCEKKTKKQSQEKEVVRCLVRNMASCGSSARLS